MRPYQVLIFVAVVMAVLGGLYWAFPEGKIGELETLDTLEAPDTPDRLEEFPVFVEVTDTIVPVEPVVEEKPVVVVPKVAVDSTTDSRIFLKSFYAALEEAGTKKVRVVHYGDSQIEEDRMTQQIREVLQNKYGGSGAGLMPLAQTIPSRTVKQELRMSGRNTLPANGPKRDLV